MEEPVMYIVHYLVPWLMLVLWQHQLQMERDNIQLARLKLRISQTRLATLARVSRFKICLHERGDLSLTPPELQRIADALREEARRIRSDAGRILELSGIRNFP